MISRSSYVRRRRQAATFSSALALCLGICGLAAADEKSDLIARLRGATESATSSKWEHDYSLYLSDLPDIEPGGLLVQIGLAQLGLDDLDGAQVTAKSLPVESRCLNCGGQSYEGFLTKLAVALVRAGHTQMARDVLKNHLDREFSWSLVHAMLAVARAQANKHEVADAKQTCQEVLRKIEGLKSAWLLIDVAETQVTIGDDDGARRSRQEAEALIGALPAKDQDRAILSANLAVVDAMRGDLAGARRLLDAAPQALEQSPAKEMDRANNDNCWRHIAVAWARIGAFPEAVRAAANIKDTWRDRANADIAIFQWIKGDLDGAERTIRLAPEGDLRDEFLVEIVRARALTGHDQQALDTMGQVKNDLRRAQATLEIGAAMAKRGKHREARDLVLKITYLRVRRSRKSPGEQFNFNDPTTWGSPYQSSHLFFSVHSFIAGEKMEGDLLAAAVRCRTALNGNGAVRFRHEMKEEFGWDLRKVAWGQASEGDAAGALAWLDRVSGNKRLGALLGTAEGYADYRNNSQRKSASPIKLNRYLPIVNDAASIRDLSENF